MPCHQYRVRLTKALVTLLDMSQSPFPTQNVFKHANTSWTSLSRSTSSESFYNFYPNEQIEMNNTSQDQLAESSQLRPRADVEQKSDVESQNTHQRVPSPRIINASDEVNAAVAAAHLDWKKRVVSVPSQSSSSFIVNSQLRNVF